MLIVQMRVSSSSDRLQALLQFVDANEMDDASEYDDAMSQLGSMSMSSAFSDDEASPLNRSSGSPGRLTEVA